MDSLLTQALRKNPKATVSQISKAVTVLSSPKVKLTIENVYDDSKLLFSIYRVNAKPGKKLGVNTSILSSVGFRYMLMDLGVGYAATGESINDQVEMAFSMHPEVQTVDKDIKDIAEHVRRLYCYGDYSNAISVIYQQYSSRDLVLETYIKHILDVNSLIGSSIRQLQAMATIRDDKLVVRIYLSNMSHLTGGFEPTEVEFFLTVSPEEIWDYELKGCKILVMLDLVSEGKISNEIFSTIRHYETNVATENKEATRLMNYKLKVSELLIKSEASNVEELRSLLINLKPEVN